MNPAIRLAANLAELNDAGYDVLGISPGQAGQVANVFAVDPVAVKKPAEGPGRRSAG